MCCGFRDRYVLREVLSFSSHHKREEKQVKTPDEFIILFPNSRSSLDEELLGSPEDTAGATKEEGEQRELSKEEKIEIKQK